MVPLVPTMVAVLPSSRSALVFMRAMRPPGKCSSAVTSISTPSSFTVPEATTLVGATPPNAHRHTWMVYTPRSSVVPPPKPFNRRRSISCSSNPNSTDTSRTSPSAPLSMRSRNRR
uniref:Putative secreted protein n=1 Tax=Anopheles marajoara TaxID=58244 RepID=A0A2M4C7L5_9DIPT